MNVLFAAPGYKPAYRIGGPVASVVATAETLVRKGHRVTVFATDSNFDQDLDVPRDQPVDVDGVEVWYFRRLSFFRRHLPSLRYMSRSIGYLYAPRMAPELDRRVPGMDVVHAQLPFVYPTYAAARAARRHVKPFFYQQRGGFAPERLRIRSLKKRLYLAAVERAVMRRATTVIALTDAETESYRAVGVETPCRVIPNGIDVGAFRREPRPGFPERWKIPPDAPMVLYMARLHPIKGADVLLEAFLRIQARFPRSVLVLAGPDETNMGHGLRDRARAAGVGHRIFLPGLVSGTDKTDLLARADLFCLPSAAEGFSNAILEAMASATAVLVSPGCHFSAVETAGAGQVVTPTADGLAAALGDLLQQPDRLRQMGEAGLRLVKDHFTWDRIVDQLVVAYQDGIRRHLECIPGAPPCSSS